MSHLANNGNCVGGLSYKSVVDLDGGNFEYQLLGIGEPRGTIRFKGVFSPVSCRSLTNEYWNEFTVGIEGTADEVFVPEPAKLAIWRLSKRGCAVGVYRRRRLITGA